MNNLRTTKSLQQNPASVRSTPGVAVIVLAVASLVSAGCSDPSGSTESAGPPPAQVTTVSGLGDSETSMSTATSDLSDRSPATQQEAVTETSGLLGKAGKLLNSAKQVTGQQATDTGQWLKGAWDGASDSTGDAVDGSLDWANQTFKNLKDQGLTTASSTGQWLSEDWQNMESFQYKVLPMSSTPAEELEGKLNELGKQGWECFSVDDQRMIFKKASESYLRRLPFKDVLRLAPLLNQMNK